MSQSGYTPIQLYRTTTAAATPTSGNLAAGELAINLTDEKLYFKNAGGTVKLLASTDTLGTVTSVAASGGTTGLTFSGSPITTSGTLTLGGTLAVANGGTGVTTSTGTGSVVLSNSPTLVTPVLGAASATSIANALGSASTPSYTFTGDTNTGIFSPAADTIAFSEGGVESMRIDASGNVGIGVTPVTWFGNSKVLQIGSGGALEGRTNLPNLVQLSANAYVDASGVTRYISTAAASSYLQYLSAHTWNVAASGTAGNAITFTQAMVIDANANITMGTSGAFSIPGTKLSITNPAASNTYVSIYGGAGSTNGGILLGGNNAENFANVFWNTSSNLLQIAATPVSSAIKFDTAGSESMRIDGSGNVGIGTTSANGKLHINGTAAALAIETRITNTSATGFTTVTFGDNTTTFGQIWAGNASYGSFGGAGSMNYSANSGPHVWYTNYVEQFRILSTGGITSANLADAVGYKGLPQNSQTGAYTLALSDMGKHISITTGGVVIPANGSVAFPIGATIVVFNNSGSTQTISITTDTLRQAGTTNTGSRTLAVYGLATLVKVTSTVWVATGNVT
jgi:hypothetical protein